MKPYGFQEPYFQRKSGYSWTRKASYRSCQNDKRSSEADRSMYRWFKRLARREGKRVIQEQRED